MISKRGASSFAIRPNLARDRLAAAAVHRQDVVANAKQRSDRVSVLTWRLITPTQAPMPGVSSEALR